MARPVKLGLDHSVSTSRCLKPAASLGSSALQVEFGEVFKFSGLSGVLLVVFLLLGDLLLAKLVILIPGQTIRDVAVGADGSCLELYIS